MRPTIESSVVGLLTQDEGLEDWWEGGPVAVPLLGGQLLPVAYTNFMPDEDSTFLSEADAALAAFLAKGLTERAEATPPVYDNYLEMLDASDIGPLDVPTPEAIWGHVSPQGLYAERHRRNRAIYLTVACECAWEEEHGLQLVSCTAGGNGSPAFPSKTATSPKPTPTTSATTRTRCSRRSSVLSGCAPSLSIPFRRPCCVPRPRLRRLGRR